MGGGLRRDGRDTGGTGFGAGFFGPFCSHSGGSGPCTGTTSVQSPAVSLPSWPQTTASLPKDASSPGKSLVRTASASCVSRTSRCCYSSGVVGRFGGTTEGDNQQKETRWGWRWRRRMDVTEACIQTFIRIMRGKEWGLTPWWKTTTTGGN